MAKKQTAVPEEASRYGGGPALGYRALPGIADEMLGADGNVRPVWQRLLATLGSMENGCRTNMAATKTSRPCVSCRR